MFLHYILHQDKQSLISKMFWAQVNKPIKNDWAIIIRKDLDELNILESFQQIEKYSKNAWKVKVKDIIKQNAFIYLKDQILERNITKVKNNKYSELKI